MSPPIFASSPPTKALVTLVLIENSQLLFPSWSVLRQHYLPTLLGTMRVANPVIPIPVLWLTTAPVGDDPASIHSPPPRQYNQLPDLKFSFSPDNRITSRIITRATELMLETATQFQDGPVGYHLFIVAASPPIQGTWGVTAAPERMGHSEWRLVAQRIAQLGIHCHMILPASQDMSPMNDLFNATLQLQGHTQVAPWFPTSSEYTLLLSGDPSTSHAQPQSDAPFPPLDPVTVDPTENMLPTDLLQNPSLSPRPPVLRHQSFPQDATGSVQGGPTPSLVSSLQKVHGLSRKKLYGTQPARQPFVREEPVRTKYKSTPTPLSIPVGSQHFAEDGRVGKAKLERGRRADRPTRVDASSSCSPVRRSSWTHVHSDMCSSPSSPATSISSRATTSPTIPVYPDLAGYPTSPSTTSATFTPTLLSSIPIPETSLVSPLGDPSGGYFSLSPQFQTPPSTAMPLSPQTPVWAPIPKPSPMPMPKTPTANRRHSQEYTHGSHVHSLSAMSGKYRLDTEPRAVTKNTQKVKDAGDVPFIFSPELEAETAAKLKAALQTTTPVSAGATMNPYSGIGQVNYAALDDAYGLSQAPVAGYDGIDGPTALNGNVHCGDVRPRFVGSTSSSLQGWAG